MIPFNYHHLYYFYVIAEEGSVTRAARRLRISQSSLSMQLAQFEGFLECRLFLREGKKLYLSEDGKHILNYAKEIFDLGQELSDSLNDRTHKGKLKIQIGVSPFIPKTFADEILNFLFDQPETAYIDVDEKSPDEMFDDLNRHKLDFVLNDLPFQAAADAGIQNHLIASIPVVLCANRTLARRIRRIPDDLNDAPVILPTSQSQTHHAVQQYFHKHRIKPRIIGEIQDLELVRRLVLSGRAVAPINKMTVMKAPAKEKLTILGKTNQFKIFDDIYLISKKRKTPHPLAARVIENFNIRL